MPVEQRDDGSLVFGYLDTGSPDRTNATDTVLVRAGQPYRAELRPYRFGALNACDISGEQDVRVQPRHSPDARPQGPLIGLLLSGRGSLEQDGRQCALAPGGFVLYTGARPFRLALGGAYRYVVWSPAATAAGPTPAPAGADPSGTATGRVLGATLAELAERAPAMSALARHERGEHVTGMIRTLLRDATAPAAPDRPGATLDRVLDWIDARLGAELTPAAIAAGQHISVRHLHALFARHGDTVGEYVRRRRLERVRADLADPRPAHLPAYALAARWGFREASHFGKLFRARYGLSPRAHRDSALRAPD
ncbi:MULTISPECIES: helix-turn-helix domain-containing protein [Kitasatospora]|uniref:helix-turn-helix domain-containing protein n=1 Tax=Kitasatospora TaxID=2063 RepID=UPI00031CC43B|nr:helix-turn-helix domain-containing protein [Kitasatospora setae]